MGAVFRLFLLNGTVRFRFLYVFLFSQQTRYVLLAFRSLLLRHVCTFYQKKHFPPAQAAFPGYFLSVWFILLMVTSLFLQFLMPVGGQRGFLPA